jgi:hypothetical protein
MIASIPKTEQCTVIDRKVYQWAHLLTILFHFVLAMLVYYYSTEPVQVRRCAITLGIVSLLALIPIVSNNAMSVPICIT